jgi:hypothetical protein
MIDAAQQVIFRNVVFQVERVEKLPLVFLIPSHHAKTLQYLRNQRESILHLLSSEFFNSIVMKQSFK